MSVRRRTSGAVRRGSGAICGPERRTLRQGLVALPISTARRLRRRAALAASDGDPPEPPGLLVLVPAASACAATSSASIGARLGTAQRRGHVRGQPATRRLPATATSRGGRDDVRVLPLWLAAPRRTVDVPRSSAARRSRSGAFVTISVVGGALGSRVHRCCSPSGSRCCRYRRGWDLDSVSTPMVTALGDMATIPRLYLATFLVQHPTVTPWSPASAWRRRCAVDRRGLRGGATRSMRRIVLEMTADPAHADPRRAGRLDLQQHRVDRARWPCRPCFVARSRRSSPRPDALGGDLRLADLLQAPDRCHRRPAVCRRPRRGRRRDRRPRPRHRRLHS